MSMWLRQSSASQEILLGRFLDSTDGNTEETALSIANTDIKLWVEGATTLASKNSGGATHIANGLYYAVLDATDTGTLGKLEVHCHPTGALAVMRTFMVLPAMIYDALVLGTDRLDTNITHVVDVDATNLSAHVPSVLRGLTTSGSTTTTVVANATTGINGGVPSATDDFYNGRVIVFTSGTLAGQATSISDYTGSTQTFTVPTMTGSPASGVTFVVV